MIRSFVDKVREEPPTDRRRVVVVGFDPDVSIMGWASVTARVGGSIPIEYVGAALYTATYQDLTGKKARKGKHQAYDVAKGLSADAEFANVLLEADCRVVVESQDFYPNKDDDRATMVSKANALIMISHVSGAAHAIALSHGRPVSVVQPSQWKGTRSKPVDHARSIRMLGHTLVSCGDVPYIAYNLVDLTQRWEHALDGLGMALYGIEQLHRGTWT